MAGKSKHFSRARRSVECPSPQTAALNRKQLEAVRHLRSELMTGLEIDARRNIAGNLRYTYVEVQLMFRAGNNPGAIS
jgi:hypothetical protein